MGPLPSTPHASPPPPERRSLADRRRRPTPFRAVFRPGGRRRGFRRAADARNQYVDCVSGRVAVLVVFTLGASALDAAFTLLHLQGGARELNPIMSAALQVGLPAFLGAKIFGTALGLIFLAIHQNFRFSRVALQGVAAAYGLLLGYHTLLFV